MWNIQCKLSRILISRSSLSTKMNKMPRSSYTPLDITWSNAVVNYCKFSILGCMHSSWYLSFAILCGRQIKSNAKKSVFIPVNCEILILIPVNHARHTPPPTPFPTVISREFLHLFHPWQDYFTIMLIKANCDSLYLM